MHLKLFRKCCPRPARGIKHHEGKFHGKWKPSPSSAPEFISQVWPSVHDCYQELESNIIYKGRSFQASCPKIVLPEKDDILHYIDLNNALFISISTSVYGKSVI